jgi:hypothetical protein
MNVLTSYSLLIIIQNQRNTSENDNSFGYGIRKASLVDICNAAKNPECTVENFLFYGSRCYCSPGLKG